MKDLSFKSVLPKNQREKTGKPLPGPRDDFMFLQGNKPGLQAMYLVAGFQDGEKTNDVYKLECRDPGSFQAWEWEQLAPCQKAGPQPRSAHACCMVGEDQIAMYGGSNDEGEKLQDLWVFDLRTRSWEKKEQKKGAQNPGPRSGHTLVHHGGSVLLFGGIYEVTNELNDIHAFSLTSLAWRVLEHNDKNAETSSPLHRNQSPLGKNPDLALNKKMTSMNNPEDSPYSRNSITKGGMMKKKTLFNKSFALQGGSRNDQSFSKVKRTKTHQSKTRPKPTI
jgi:hypothetical protein